MRLFIGFDVGGTHVKHGLFTEEGEVLIAEEYDTHYDRQLFLSAWQSVVAGYRQHNEIAGIAISFPGYINPYTGQVPKAGSLTFLDGCNLLEMFGELTDLPITVENDANCAALGEMWLGAGHDYDSLVCVTIGTGIGGGIIVNRELMRGSHFRAGEFGVLPVGQYGEDMHQLASAKGLMDACRREMNIPADEKIHGQDIFARAETDLHIQGVIDNWVKYLARGIYSVVSLFDPQAILLGGGVSTQPMLYPMLERHLEGFKFWDVLKVPIRPCKLGNKAGMLGAVWLAKQKD
ncbi:ROK family protein [Cedecea colo]|uniref:ROK family protein n=1 Tax=Cedecea colo TaxID=2552946 RepID=A0ABX0VQ84_9ENTR|nr:ROK family protein [Cedecea colo]NIY48871.1 ROK family protein [Cedecea colo]